MENTTTAVFALILVIIVVSLLGFCIENIFIGFRRGFIDNRNMVLPFLLGYGLTIFGFYLLFGTPEKPLFFGKQITFSASWRATLYYFIMAFVAVCIGEIVLGYTIEWGCNIIWWDYNSLPLHITRYTSVPTSLGFASLITIFMKYMFYPLIKLFLKLNPKALAFLAITLSTLLVLDMTNSTVYMFKNQSLLQLWRVDFAVTVGEVFKKTN